MVKVDKKDQKTPEEDGRISQGSPQLLRGERLFFERGPFVCERTGASLYTARDRPGK
jgi:hypothetical protein